MSLRVPMSWSGFVQQQKPHKLKANVEASTPINIPNEAIEVYDAEKNATQLQQLDYATWLPFAAKTYHISPRIEDYIIVATPICPSDIPNRNGIAFPRTELARFMPPPIARMAYKAWAGCPVHLEHDNEDHTKAYGVVLDASLHKISGYGQGQLWKVMGLAAIDKNKYPDVAQKVLTKEINTYSMGALVDGFSCSYCGTPYHQHHNCGHVTGPDTVNWRSVTDPFQGTDHICFLNAHGIKPIELSIVADPAWAPALSDTILPSIG